MTFDDRGKPVPKGQDGDFLASTMGTSTTPPGGGISYRSTLDGLLTGSSPPVSTVVGASSTSAAATSTIREGPTPRRFTFVHDHHGTGPSPRSIANNVTTTNNGGSNRDPAFAIDILAALGASNTRHITHPPAAISSRTLPDGRPLPRLLTTSINNNISSSGAAHISPNASYLSSRNDPHNIYTTIQNNNNMLSLNPRNLAFDNNPSNSPIIPSHQQMLMLERMIMANSTAAPPVTYRTPSSFPLSQHYHQHGPNHDLLSPSLFVDHHRLISPHLSNNRNTYGFGGLLPMTQSLQSSAGFPGVPRLPLNRMMLNDDPQFMSRINQFPNGGGEDLVDTVTANTRLIQDLLSSSAQLSSIVHSEQDYLMSRDTRSMRMQVDDYRQQLLAAQERLSYQREGGGTTTASSNTIVGVHSSPEYAINLNNHSSSSSSIPMMTAAAIGGTNAYHDTSGVTNVTSPASHQPRQGNQKRAFSSLTIGTTNDDDMNGKKDADDSAPRPAHNSSPKKQKQSAKKSADHDDESSQPSSSSSSSSHHDDNDQTPQVASINNKKSSTNKDSKKSNKIKKGDGEASEKTRHPLNAYNFFFSDERERIIQSLLQTGKLPDENIDDNNTTKRLAITDEERKKKLLEHIEYRRSIKAKGRPHRKTHGVISFSDLASEISARWKRLLPHRVQYYQELAEMDRELYHREQLMSGNKEQKKSLSGGGAGDNERSKHSL